MYPKWPNHDCRWQVCLCECAESKRFLHYMSSVFQSFFGSRVGVQQSEVIISEFLF